MGFKYLLMLCLLCGSVSQAAELWQSAAGEYRFENSKYKDSGVVLELRDNGLMMSVYGPLWSSTALQLGLRFKCAGARCEMNASDRQSVTLIFQNSNSFVYNESSLSERMVRKSNGGGGGGTQSTWNFKEYADANQVVYSAYQNDASTGATLVVSCKAKSEQLNWAIRLSEKSYLAAQGAVLYAKAALRGAGKVDGMPAQNSMWVVADNRYIIAQDGAPLSIKDLKTGSELNFSLIGIKPDGDEVKLESMSFSLKGSTAALNKLLSSCQNSTSDLPIPLP